MPINSLFNETELTIFYRQTRFSFGDYHQLPDGTICAVDELSRQVFIGKDLFRNNVHDLDSIESANPGNNGTISLKFKGMSAIEINAEGDDAEAVISVLRGFLKPAESQEPGAAGRRPSEEYEAPAESEEPATEAGTTEDEEMYEAMEDEEPEESEPAEDQPEWYEEFDSDGSMTEEAVFAVVKGLKFGDRVHLEYKPLLGRQRVCEVEFEKVKIDLFGNKYFDLTESADNFHSLMDQVADALFGYMELVFYNKDICTEGSCKLKRIKVIRKLQ